MKKTLFMIIMALMAITATAEQEDKKFDPRKFRSEQEAFITKEAKLSAKEAAAFFPLFWEMQDKQRALFHQQMKLARQQTTNDKDAAKQIDEMDELELRMVKLKIQYHSKFCKVIPAQKVKLCIKAEERHKRNIMDKLVRGHKTNKPGTQPKPNKPAKPVKPQAQRR